MYIRKDKKNKWIYLEIKTMATTSSFSGHTFNNAFQYALIRIFSLKKGTGFYVPQHIQERLRTYFPDLNMGMDSFIKEHDFTETYEQHFVPDLFDQNDRTCFNGFFQTHKYFEGWEKNVKEWFAIDKLVDFNLGNTCLIHFRGNDYVGGWNYLPMSYYEEAMQKVRELNPLVEFKVVTDDVTAAKTFFPELEIISTTSVDDFRRLTSSNYLILNNSSFSWWAAYLNDKAKIRVAPSRWFNYQRNYDKAGLGKTVENNNDWYPADIHNDIFTWI